MGGWCLFNTGGHPIMEPSSLCSGKCGWPSNRPLHIQTSKLVLAISYLVRGGILEHHHLSGKRQNYSSMYHVRLYMSDHANQFWNILFWSEGRDIHWSLLTLMGNWFLWLWFWAHSLTQQSNDPMKAIRSDLYQTSHISITISTYHLSLYIAFLSWCQKW